LTGRLLSGLIIVMIGALLLLNTTGYLPWSIWASAMEFWPVLIIGLGVQVALSKWRVPGLALAVVVVLILGAMYPYAGSNTWLRRFGIPTRRSNIESDEDFTISLRPDVSGVALFLEAPAYRVLVRGDSDRNSPDTALRARLKWTTSEPSISESTNGQRLEVRVTAPSSQPVQVFGNQNWDIAINPSLVSTLFLNGGVVGLGLDCTELYVDTLNVDAGVSDLDLNIGQLGKETKVMCTGGVANVTLTVPKDAGVRISIAGPSVIPHDFSKQGLTKAGGVWTTPDYQNARSKIDLSVSSGVSRVYLARK
jgi:hypothetical protein